MARRERYLLKEDGDFFLLESGGRLLLERRKKATFLSSYTKYPNASPVAESSLADAP